MLTQKKYDERMLSRKKNNKNSARRLKKFAIELHKRPRDIYDYWAVRDIKRINF